MHLLRLDELAALDRMLHIDVLLEASHPLGEVRLGGAVVRRGEAKAVCRRARRIRLTRWVCGCCTALTSGRLCRLDKGLLLHGVEVVAALARGQRRVAHEATHHLALLVCSHL